MGLKQLLEKRAKLVAEARSFYESHQSDWNDEHEARWSAMNTDIDKMTAEIRRLEQLANLEQIESEDRQSQGTQVVVEPVAGQSVDIPVTARPEYRAAHLSWMRTGDASEMRALQITIDPQGGYLVPDEYQRTMIQALDEYLAFRQYATVLNISGDRQIPVSNQDGEAHWTGEMEDYTETDETFGLKVLVGHKLTYLQKFSEELVQDSAFAIDSHVAQACARAFATKEEAGFTTGNGVGRPTGWTVDAETGVTADSATAIDPDEIIDLFYSLKAPYRRRAAWQLNDTTIAAIRKLKDNDGVYLWGASLVPGQPDTILGRPIIANNSMATIEANAKVMGFGDWSFYWIADRGQSIVQRLVELYAESGQIGYKMAIRTDGRLVLPEAVKMLVMGAGGS